MSEEENEMPNYECGNAKYSLSMQSVEHITMLKNLIGVSKSYTNSTTIILLNNKEKVTDELKQVKFFSTITDM